MRYTLRERIMEREDPAIGWSATAEIRADALSDRRTARKIGEGIRDATAEDRPLPSRADANPRHAL
jgi:hypothetical protein